MIEWEWTEKRRDKFADVLIGLGHVIVAATVLRGILEVFDLKTAILGGLFSLALWSGSLVLVERKQ